MTTIVNNPPAPKEENGIVGIIVGLIVFIIAGYLVIMYGIPAIRQLRGGGTQINIPSKIDVNINQGK